MSWIKHLRKRERTADLELLWPAICDLANDLQQAQWMFLQHILQDPAWSHLTDIEKEVFAFKLEAPRPSDHGASS